MVSYHIPLEPHFLRPYQFNMPHFDVGRVAPARAPVNISEMPAHLVFKGRIAENGLEDHFVRAIGIFEASPQPHLHALHRCHCRVWRASFKLGGGFRCRLDMRIFRAAPIF
jgi:hypothetical protein